MKEGESKERGKRLGEEGDGRGTGEEEGGISWKTGREKNIYLSIFSIIEEQKTR